MLSTPVPAGLHGFAPSRSRAAALDLRVREELAGSLERIAVRIGPAIGFTEQVAASVAATLRARRVSPGVFGLYTDLVEAAFREDAAGACLRARDLIAATELEPRPLQLVTLSDADLGPDQAARYLRLINDDPSFMPPMDPVTSAKFARAAALVDDGVALLDAGAPEVAEELRALVLQIVLVRSAAPAGDDEALVLDGASSFYLWGALFLNSARQTTRLGMAVALVHEAAHSLLFGMTLGASLVENDAAERFASPLRYDLRPMDGLAHATYVLARMIDCLRRLIDSGVLQTHELSVAKETMVRHAREHAGALRTVNQSARFTTAGAAAFAAMTAGLQTA